MCCIRAKSLKEEKMNNNDYWTSLVQNTPEELRVVYKQHHFVLNFRAGQRQFNIEFNDGRTLRCGLWAQGRIPEGIEIPDNAILITTELGAPIFTITTSQK